MIWRSSVVTPGLCFIVGQFWSLDVVRKDFYSSRVPNPWELSFQFLSFLHGTVLLEVYSAVGTVLPVLCHVTWFYCPLEVSSTDDIFFYPILGNRYRTNIDQNFRIKQQQDQLQPIWSDTWARGERKVLDWLQVAVWYWTGCIEPPLPHIPSYLKVSRLICHWSQWDCKLYIQKLTSNNNSSRFLLLWWNWHG